MPETHNEVLTLESTTIQVKPLCLAVLLHGTICSSIFYKNINEILNFLLNLGALPALLGVQGLNQLYTEQSFVEHVERQIL